MVFLSFFSSKKDSSTLLDIQAAHVEVDGELGERVQRDQSNEWENQLLVTDEGVEFEKYLFEVQEFREITDRYKGIYRVHEKEKDVSM